MAWTAARTWIAGETVTAAMFAAVFGQLRANAPALVSAAEDLVQGSGVAGTPLQRLGKGADGTALRSGASLLAWGGAPTGVKTGVADLTDTNTVAAAQWGTEEAVVANPAVASVAVAFLSGVVALAAGTGYVDCEISLDGGSTWTHQPDTHNQVASLTRTCVLMFHRRTGTPTGDVQARGKIEGYSGGPTALYGYQGRIILLVWPGTA